MKEILFFNINRMNFVGGAEIYMREMGSIFIENKLFVKFISGNRFILSCYFLIQKFPLLLTSPKFFFNEFRVLSRLIENQFDELPYGSRGVQLSFIDTSRVDLFERCDVVFLKNEPLDLLFFLALSNHSIRKKTFVLLLTSPFNTNETFIRRFFYSRYFYSALLSRFAGVVVSNDEDGKFVETIGGASCVFQKYPAPISILQWRRRFLPIFSSEKRVNRLRVSNIIFVGRLEDQKGIYDFIRLFEIYGVSRSNTKWTVVGSGSHEPLVQDWGNRYTNFHYLGTLDGPQLFEEIARSDLLVFPSKWETFGYVALESLLLGTKVLCYDIPGPNGIVYKSEYGWRCGSFDQMSKTLGHLLNDCHVYFDSACVVDEFSRENFYISLAKSIGLRD